MCNSCTEACKSTEITWGVHPRDLGPSPDTLCWEVREKARSEGLPVPAVYDLRRLKPLDADALDDVLARFPLIAVAEENYLAGGVSEEVAARIAEGGRPVRLRRFGVPDVCVPHATTEEQRELYGLTADNILAACRPLL